MIILTDCLGNQADEGGMKVCSTLAMRLRSADASATVVSYGAEKGQADVHMPVNKLMLSWRLCRFLRRRRERVLLLPSYARMLPMAGRILILSLLAGRRIRALIVMRAPMNRLAGLLLKASGAEILCLSAESAGVFAGVIGSRARQIKTGVDTQRFVPVDAKQKALLRRKYGLPEDKKVVLHVGHMKAGRGVAELLKLDSPYHGALVVSTLTAAEADQPLRAKLEEKENLTILDAYVPRIEELYQLADVYLFPVTAERNCIDVPLSVLEAAACGVPVVAAEYGETKQLLSCEGFHRLESFDADDLNAQLDAAIHAGENPRPPVLAYDWQHAVRELLQ